MVLLDVLDEVVLEVVGVPGSGGTHAPRMRAATAIGSARTALDRSRCGLDCVLDNTCFAFRSEDDDVSPATNGDHRGDRVDARPVFTHDPSPLPQSSTDVVELAAPERAFRLVVTGTGPDRTYGCGTAPGSDRLPPHGDEWCAPTWVGAPGTVSVSAGADPHRSAFSANCHARPHGFGHTGRVREITWGLTGLALLWAAFGCGAWWVLARKGRPWLGIVMGIAAIAGLALRTLVVWGYLGLGRFGEIHGVYLAAVLSIPILGAFVAGASLVGRPGGTPGGTRRAGIALAGASLAVVPATFGFYATHVAPFQLRIQTVQASVAPGRHGDATIRIAVLSDIQTTAVGDHERAAVRAAMATRPDIILIPGDILQGTDEQTRAAAPQMKELLAQLDAPGGVFVVGGDVERSRNIDAVRPESMVRLDDEVTITTVRDRSVAIGGTRIGYDAPEALAVKDELMSLPSGTVRVLLSHRPDTVLSLAPDAAIDLTVAGHTHGGQVAVPFIGPLMTLTDVARPVAAGGLHQVHGNQIYVSPGIGMERGRAPQIRFGVPPTVGIVDLG